MNDQTFQFDNVEILKWKLKLSVQNVRILSEYLQNRGKEAEYSDEEESDTEEYKENRHKVTSSQAPSYASPIRNYDPLTHWLTDGGEV